MSAYVALTSLAASFPFIRSGALALMINNLVSAVKTGRGTVTERDIILLAVYVASALLPSLIVTIKRYLTARMNFFMQEQYEIAILQQQGNLDAARHEDKEFSDLFNRVTENGVWRLQNFLLRLMDGWDDVIGVIIAIVVLGISNWIVLLTIIIATIPELVAEGKYGQRIFNLLSASSEIRRRYFDLRRHFYSVGNIIELKLFQNVPHFVGLIRDMFSGLLKEQADAEGFKMRQRFVTLTISQAAISFATIWFFISVLHGNIQIGTLTFLLSSIGQLRSSLSNFFSILGMQYQDSLFVSDLFKYLDTEPMVRPPQNGIRVAADIAPEIIFEDVTFGYPDMPKPVLKDFNLRIVPGEKLALVGINGAGKTTVVKLLGRFYDPQEGRILVNGHDLRDIDLDSWYHIVGALFHDYANYRFIVRDSISVGRAGKESDLGKVVEAAKAAEADAFILEWEKQYEQMLGKSFTNAMEPSVGQWQKLALARTFYRDPRVLILDEPTAAVDAEAEAKIFERIQQVSSGRTTILISHRFSTVRQADRIAVIKDGGVSELGTHEELIKHDSDYARLFKQQAKGYQ